MELPVPEVPLRWPWVGVEGARGPRGSSANWAPAEGQGSRPGALLFAGQPEAGALTMASPTTLNASTLARSRAPSEKRLLSRPMTRPWKT